MTTPSEDYGLLSFLPLESYSNPIRGLDFDSKIDYLMDVLVGEGSRLQAANWMTVKRAIRRQQLFVLEASTPFANVLIRFDPTDVKAGNYRIQYHRPPKVEVGKIEQIAPFDCGSKDLFFSKLKKYPTTFQIVSFREPGGKRSIWFIGLAVYEQFEEEVEIAP